MHKKIILISFSLIQLCCGTLFGMELVPKDCDRTWIARKFVRKFPDMKFLEARKTFEKLDLPTQTTIWDIVKKHDNENKNHNLSAALNIATLLKESEHQCMIVHQDFDRAQDNWYILQKNKNKIIDLLKTSTIKDFFMLRAMIHTINKKQPLPTETLIIFKEFNTLVKDLTNYYEKNDTNIVLDKITISYREKQTLQKTFENAKNSCKNIAPYVALPLLYSHLLMKPTWDTIPGIKESYFGTKGSFKKVGSNCLSYYKPLTPITIGLPTLYMAYWTFIHNKNNSNYTKAAKGFFSDTLVSSTIASVASIIPSFIAYYTSKLIFSYGVPIGLAGISFVTSLYGVIKGRAWKTESVKLKAENLTALTELINKYLNNPDIEIQET